VAARDLPDLVPQETLQTERITLVPLADERLQWEVELDSDLEYEMTREQRERGTT
jgi:hypothetical protein